MSWLQASIISIGILVAVVIIAVRSGWFTGGSGIVGSGASAVGRTVAGWLARVKFGTLLGYGIVISLVISAYSVITSGINRRAEARTRAIAEQTAVLRQYGMRFNPHTDTILNVSAEGTRYITPPPGRSIRWHSVDSVSYGVHFRTAEGDTGTVEFPKEFTGCTRIPPFRSFKFVSREARSVRIILQVLPEGENIPSDCIGRRPPHDSTSRSVTRHNQARGLHPRAFSYSIFNSNYLSTLARLCRKCQE